MAVREANVVSPEDHKTSSDDDISDAELEKPRTCWKGFEKWYLPPKRMRNIKSNVLILTVVVFLLSSTGRFLCQHELVGDDTNSEFVHTIANLASLLLALACMKTCTTEHLSCVLLEDGDESEDSTTEFSGPSRLKTAVFLRCIFVGFLFGLASFFQTLAQKLGVGSTKNVVIGYLYLPAAAIFTRFYLQERTKNKAKYDIQQWLSLSLITLSSLAFAFIRERSRWPWPPEQDVQPWYGYEKLFSHATFLVLASVILSAGASVLAEDVLHHVCDTQGEAHFFLLKACFDSGASTFSLLSWLLGIAAHQGTWFGRWTAGTVFFVLALVIESWSAAYMVRCFSTVRRSILYTGAFILVVCLDDIMKHALGLQRTHLFSFFLGAPTVSLAFVTAASAFLFRDARTSLKAKEYHQILLRKKAEQSTAIEDKSERQKITEQKLVNNTDKYAWLAFFLCVEVSRNVFFQVALQGVMVTPQTLGIMSFVIGLVALTVQTMGQPVDPQKFASAAGAEAAQSAEKDMTAADIAAAAGSAAAAAGKSAGMNANDIAEAAFNAAAAAGKRANMNAKYIAEAAGNAAAAAGKSAGLSPTDIAEAVEEAGKEARMKEEDIAVAKEKAQERAKAAAGHDDDDDDHSCDVIQNSVKTAWNLANMFELNCRALFAGLLFAIGQSCNCLSYAFGISAAMNAIIGVIYVPATAVFDPMLQPNHSRTWRHVLVVLITFLTAISFGWLHAIDPFSGTPNIPVIAMFFCAMSAILSALGSPVLNTFMFNKYIFKNYYPYHVRKVVGDVASLLFSIPMLWIIGNFSTRPADAFWKLRPLDKTCSSHSCDASGLVCKGAYWWYMTCDVPTCSAGCGSGLAIQWDHYMPWVAGLVLAFRNYMKGFIMSKASTTEIAIAEAMVPALLYFVGEGLVQHKSMGDMAVNIVACIVPLSTLFGIFLGDAEWKEWDDPRKFALDQAKQLIIGTGEKIEESYLPDPQNRTESARLCKVCGPEQKVVVKTRTLQQPDFKVAFVQAASHRFGNFTAGYEHLYEQWQSSILNKGFANSAYFQSDSDE